MSLLQLLSVSYLPGLLYDPFLNRTPRLLSILKINSVFILNLSCLSKGPVQACDTCAVHFLARVTSIVVFVRSTWLSSSIRSLLQNPPLYVLPGHASWYHTGMHMRNLLSTVLNSNMQCTWSIILWFPECESNFAFLFSEFLWFKATHLLHQSNTPASWKHSKKGTMVMCVKFEAKSRGGGGGGGGTAK